MCFLEAQDFNPAPFCSFLSGSWTHPSYHLRVTANKNAPAVSYLMCSSLVLGLGSSRVPPLMSSSTTSVRKLPPVLQEPPGLVVPCCAAPPADTRVGKPPMWTRGAIKFLRVFWRRPHLLLGHAVCSITVLLVLVCLLILSHKAVPSALCHWIRAPFSLLPVLPFPLLLVPHLGYCYGYEFSFLQKEMEGTSDQNHCSPITDHATLFSCSFITSSHASYINLWVFMFTTLLCLCLQPSLCSIPPFCLGHTVDLLPSSCLYVHKHLFLVSFPVFFRLQHNLPSWLFAADSNGSLKHTTASLFWNKPASHPNTNLLPWVLTHILITDQFQPAPLSETLKIYHFLSR